MAKKRFAWIWRLIDRITRSEQSNNDYFTYYGHRVALQSGMRDFVDVYIADMNDRNQINFSFDYDLKELCFFSYNNYDERDAIIKAFKRIYNGGWYKVGIGCDEPWEEERKELELLVDNDEYDQEQVMREYEELMNREAA